MESELNAPFEELPAFEKMTSRFVCDCELRTREALCRALLMNRTSQQLGQLLVEVEDYVGVLVLAGDGVCPQFLHEEDLVGELRYRT